MSNWPVVRWERLDPISDRDTDFLFVVYEAGGSSSSDSMLMRHAGREHAIVVKGTLMVQIGFDVFELRTGDAVSFDCSRPHRYWMRFQVVIASFRRVL